MILNSVFFFLLGLFIGSFLNVLIYRIPKNLGFLIGRSFCDNCKKNLLWYDLFPVISFVFLKGKCRFCKNKISFKIPLVELITGILFALTYYSFPLLNIFLIYYLFIICSSIVIFFIDLKNGIIPDKILFPTFVITLFFAYLNGIIINSIISSVTAFVFFYFLYLITRGRGMGFGDVKFSLVLGLIFGFPKIIICLYIAFLTGAIASLILIIWGKKKFKKDTIAFGPFLSLGALLTIFLGNLLVSRLLSYLQ